MKRISILFIGLMVLVSVGCFVDSKDSNDNLLKAMLLSQAGNLGGEPELQGTWSYPCVSYMANASVKLSYVVTGSNMSMNQVTYSGESCESNKRTGEMRINFIYEVGDTVTDAVDGKSNKEIDQTNNIQTITVYDEQIASRFDGKFGLTEFPVGVPVSTFGYDMQTGLPLPTNTANRKYYTIYRLDGTKLYFATFEPEHDGSTPEKRPTEINLSYYYEK